MPNNALIITLCFQCLLLFSLRSADWPAASNIQLLFHTSYLLVTAWAYDMKLRFVRIWHLAGPAVVAKKNKLCCFPTWKTSHTFSSAYFSHVKWLCLHRHRLPNKKVSLKKCYRSCLKIFVAHRSFKSEFVSSFSASRFRKPFKFRLRRGLWSCSFAREQTQQSRLEVRRREKVSEKFAAAKLSSPLRQGYKRKSVKKVPSLFSSEEQRLRGNLLIAMIHNFAQLFFPSRRRRNWKGGRRKEAIRKVEKKRNQLKVFFAAAAPPLFIDLPSNTVHPLSAE